VGVGSQYVIGDQRRQGHAAGRCQRPTKFRLPPKNPAKDVLVLLSLMTNQYPLNLQGTDQAFFSEHSGQQRIKDNRHSMADVFG